MPSGLGMSFRSPPEWTQISEHNQNVSAVGKVKRPPSKEKPTRKDIDAARQDLRRMLSKTAVVFAFSRGARLAAIPRFIRRKINIVKHISAGSPSEAPIVR